MNIRKINKNDITQLADIRSAEWGTHEYWVKRINKYLNSESSPQQALIERIIYVAENKNKIIGFIAGHLTTRFGCEGELQWINVVPEFQGKNIASDLLKKLAAWFAEQNAKKICVNVEPDNFKGMAFYKKHGAEKMDDYWMVWEDVSILKK